MAKWKVPDDLPREDKNEIFHWHVRKWPHHFKHKSDRVTFVANEIEKCLNYHGSRDNKAGIRDFKRACRNWIIKSMEQRGYEPYRPPSSKPSARGKRPFESGERPMEPIGKQLKLLEEKK